MRNSLKRIFLAIFAIIVFSLSTVAPSIPQSASSQGADWLFTDGNSFNWNYSPQTQITTANAGQLRVNWIFPIPAAPISWASFGPGANSGTGIGNTPIVYKGVAYIVTQFWEVFALDVGTGKLIWSTNLPIYPNETKGFGHDTALQSSHFHNSCCALTTNNILGGPTLWVDTITHHIIALDAFTGKVKENFEDLTFNCTNGPNNAVLSCSGHDDNYGIQGNLGTYGVKSPALVIDQARGIMMTSALGTSSAASGRGFVRGWDITQTPPKLLWTTYLSPPQDGSRPDWDISQVNNMTGAWIATETGAVNLKTLTPSVLNATLYNDWGYVESPACKAAYGSLSTGGVGEGWGGPWSLDPKTGNFFFNTNNKNPYEGPCTPGPDLWAASVVSINDVTGKLNWGFQAVAHDEWDWDCAWNQVLANQTINGQQTEVLYKSCKSGYIYELNANTGALIWSYFPTNYIKIGPYSHLFNPLNRTQMTLSWPNPTGGNFLFSPSLIGGIENDFAFDPVNNIIVAVEHNVPNMGHYVPLNASNWQTSSGYGGVGGFVPKDNASAFGINAATGQEIWHYLIKDIGYRGGVTISGGVAYLTLSTGYLTMLDVKTGAVVSNLLIGGPLNTLPAIAQATDGTETVLVPITAGLVTYASSSPPGDLVALTLAAPSSGTQGTTTVVQSAPSGVSDTTFYGVVGVAVIFIITTGFLALRRRTPAP